MKQQLLKPNSGKRFDIRSLNLATNKNQLEQLPLPRVDEPRLVDHDFSQVPLTGGEVAHLNSSYPVSPTSYPFGGDCHGCSVQAKLTIGQPNNKFEQEADRISDQVINMPGLLIHRACPACDENETIQPKHVAHQITPLVQRLVEPGKEGEEPVQAKLSNVQQLQRQEMVTGDEEEEGVMQAKGCNGQTPQVSPRVEGQIRSLQGSGKPLSKSVRDFFESRFGHNFSQVRVHTDVGASALAQGINAKACTIGQDIFFGSSQFAPDSMGGRRLLAHELTHVIHQSHTNMKSDKAVIQRKVCRYCREVETGNSVMDALAGILDLEHCWLKTDTRAAGMGPVQEGPLPAWPFGIPTMITDHSQELHTNSTEINGIDENCVNQELEIGRSTGEWSVGNNCNTFVDDVIATCRERMYELDREFVRSGAFGIEPSGPDPVNIAAGNEPFFVVRPLPAQHSLGFRWIIADSQDRRYLMMGDQGRVFRYGPQSSAYIPSRTRALLRERNITTATILCRIIGGGEDRLIRLPVRFVW